jgi:dTDP-4-dehydrorhamnose reductase
MLAADLLVALEGDVIGLDRAALDITDADAVRAAVAGMTVVVNTAAWAGVDAAEADEPRAAAVNAAGPAILAAACAEEGATLVHYSTDYVFDGRGTHPYDEDAPVHPVNAYGRTKAEGEARALSANPGRTHIVRTSWLYGQHGPSFPRTMLSAARDRETLRVVDDQVGAPTWTADLASATVQLLRTDVPGRIWHWTNGGSTTWYGLARRVFEYAGLDPARIEPTSSEEFVRPAPRPAYSVLGHGAWLAAGFEAPRDWDEALRAAFDSGSLTP